MCFLSSQALNLLTSQECLVNEKVVNEKNANL